LKIPKMSQDEDSIRSRTTSNASTVTPSDTLPMPLSSGTASIITPMSAMTFQALWDSEDRHLTFTSPSPASNDGEPQTRSHDDFPQDVRAFALSVAETEVVEAVVILGESAPEATEEVSFPSDYEKYIKNIHCLHGMRPPKLNAPSAWKTPNSVGYPAI
jgi:hypothetical protein